jgi:hypothetical protein
MQDIFDNAIPKYSTASEIYEKLEEIYYNEEASILSEMFPDVSYDNQDYYYTAKGSELKEKFDVVSGYGENMWIMDLAVSKLNAYKRDPKYPSLDNLHDIIFEATYEESLAKRIGFKKLFVEYMLFGEAKIYAKYLEEFEEELRELNRFSWHENFTSWQKVINANNFRTYHNGYRDFSSAVHRKILGLQLETEMTCIAECRSFLISYDDFILGLKINQEMFARHEDMYKSKLAALQAKYESEIKKLYAMAENQGLLIILDDTKLLESAVD